MIEEQPYQRLETTFNCIQRERMEGVPVLNERLCVKAIGFHEWNGYQLGILITPWFMNLMLLPATVKVSNESNMGDIQTHIFPSGAYDFIVGYEQQFGLYLSCSLFSPMFEFEDQQEADLTAQEALAALMDEENFDQESQHRTQEIAEIWSGEKTISPEKDGFNQKSEAQAESELVQSSPQKLIKETASRRDFLRGNVFNSGSDL